MGIRKSLKGRQCDGRLRKRFEGWKKERKEMKSDKRDFRGLKRWRRWGLKRDTVQQ